MPRGGPMGRGGNPNDKAKDFKGAMKRLFSELKPFKILIYVSLILAVLGSIMSIIAPNKLSSLTDEISGGLVVNTDNLKTLTEKVISNFDDKKIEEKMELIKDMEISSKDKKQFLDAMSTLSEGDITEESISSIPESIQEVLLDEIEIDKTKINSKDQIEFIKLMSTMTDETAQSELYPKIDKMPESIQNVIKPFMNMDAIKKITAILASLYIASALFTFIESILMTDVANRFAKTLRSRISIKINKLPLRYFDKNSIGDILSRVTNDVDTIAQSMNQSLSTLVSSITLFLGTIIMMFYTNWIMALTAIGASLIGFIFMFLILGKSQKYFVARQVELGKLNGHIEEIYSGLNVVKVYNGKKLADEKFDILNKNVYEANRKSQFLSGLMRTYNELYRKLWICCSMYSRSFTYNE